MPHNHVLLCGMAAERDAASIVERQCQHLRGAETPAPKQGAAHDILRRDAGQKDEVLRLWDYIGPPVMRRHG